MTHDQSDPGRPDLPSNRSCEESSESLAIPYVKALVLSPDRTRFLLQQRCKPGDLYKGFWELPGGKMREGESIEASVRREVEEEAGVTIRSVLGQETLALTDRFGRSARLVRPIAVVETTWESHVLLGHYFVCLADGQPSRSMEGELHRWITPEEFQREFLEGGVEGGFRGGDAESGSDLGREAGSHAGCTTLDLLALRTAFEDGVLRFFAPMDP